MTQSVTIRLLGGLGNQMFQYAAARAVAIQNNALLRLDLSWFGTDPDRQFALAPFNIQAETFVDKDSLPSTGWTARMHQRVKRRLKWSKDGVPVFSEKSFGYDAAIQRLRAPISLDGYFQSERYFSPIRDQIAKDFRLRADPAGKTQEMLDRIANVDAICLHIRRGDYVSNAAANAYHGTCSLDYYRSGLSLAAAGLAKPHCFVFSDDPAWVRHHFQADVPMTQVDIHGTHEAHEDLRLMAACKRFVIANSSLSWWGAWLGSQNDKLVVAPKRWFQDTGKDTRDLIPADWRRV